MIFVTMVLLINWGWEVHGNDVSCGEKVLCNFVERFFFQPLNSSSGSIEEESGLSSLIVQLADRDIDQKVDFQEFLNFTEPIITKGLRAVDQNEDGEVSKSEAAYFVEHLNISLTIRTVRNLFDTIDLNGDGTLSTADLPLRSRNLFDTDNDGVVSLRELLGHPLVFFPAPIQSVFKVLDSDRDESVTRVEFDNFLNFLRRLLAVIDNNQDCAVRVEEVLEAFDRAHLPKDFQLVFDLLARSHTAMARYVLLATVEQADLDGNSRMSVDELVNFESKDFLDSVTNVLLHTHPRESTGRWLGYLTGQLGLDGTEGKSESDVKALFNKALAAWLSTLQGFISAPAFKQTPSTCS